MVPRAQAAGRLLLTGGGYEPEAATIMQGEPPEFDRKTTVADWKKYFAAIESPS